MSINRDPVTNNLFGIPNKGNTYKLTISTTASVEQELSANTLYRVTADQNIQMCVCASGVTADDADMLLWAEDTEYFACSDDENYISVSGIDSAGTCYVTELSPTRDWVKI